MLYVAPKVQFSSQPILSQTLWGRTRVSLGETRAHAQRNFGKLSLEASCIIEAAFQELRT